MAAGISEPFVRAVCARRANRMDLQKVGGQRSTHWSVRSNVRTVGFVRSGSLGAVPHEFKYRPRAGTWSLCLDGIAAVQNRRSRGPLDVVRRSDVLADCVLEPRVHPTLTFGSIRARRCAHGSLGGLHDGRVLSGAWSDRRVDWCDVVVRRCTPLSSSRAAAHRGCSCRLARDLGLCGVFKTSVGTDQYTELCRKRLIW